MLRRKRGRPPKNRAKARGVGRVDVKLPYGLIQEIEKLVEQRIYMTKADFVRCAVRDKLLCAAAPPEAGKRGQ
ncbi:MAG: ribbon-helix-helix domain-containing protein [Planctomycetota bacterium]